MALTTAQLVTQLYVGFYNRAPDPEGLNYWIGRVNAGVSLADIANSFAASPEAISTYPYLALPNVVSPESFLNSIYMNLFGRPIDTGAGSGLEYYSQMLADGVRPGEVLAKIQLNANTNEGTADQAYLANKVAVGLSWAETAANTPGFEYNAAAAGSANSILAGVTDDPSTVTAAEAQIDVFFDNLGLPSQELKVTADNLVGSNVDSVFTANLGQNPTTLATVQTLTDIDIITGGSGKETLTAELIDGTAAGIGPRITGVETIQLTAYAGAALSLARSTGYETIRNINSLADLTVFGAKTVADLEVINVAGNDTELSYDNIAVAEQNVSLNTVSGNVAISGVSGQIGTLNLDVVGGVGVFLEDDAASAENLVITGSGELAISGDFSFAGLVDLDASGYTGDLNIDVSGSSDLTNVLTGEGDDVVHVAAATMDADLSVNLGGGDNTLSIYNVFSGASITGLDFTNVTNVQTLSLDYVDLNGVDGVLDLSGFATLPTTVEFGSFYGDNQVLTITGADEDLSIEVSNTYDAQNGGLIVDAVNLTVNSAFDLDIEDIGGANLETLTLTAEGDIDLDTDSNAQFDLSKLVSLSAVSGAEADIRIDADDADADVEALKTISVSGVTYAALELDGVADYAGSGQVQEIDVLGATGVGEAGVVTIAVPGVGNINVNIGASQTNAQIAAAIATAIDNLSGYTANASGGTVYTQTVAAGSATALTLSASGDLGNGDFTVDPAFAGDPAVVGFGFGALETVLVESSEGNVDVEIDDAFGAFTVEANAFANADIDLTQTGVTAVSVTVGSAVEYDTLVPTTLNSWNEADIYIDDAADLTTITVTGAGADVELSGDLGSLTTIDLSAVSTVAYVYAQNADFGATVSYLIGATSNTSTNVDAVTIYAEWDAGTGNTREIFDFVGDNIGEVVIYNFEGGVDATRDALDLSGFGINASSNLTFTDVNAGNDLLITAADGQFDGSILLVGLGGDAAVVALNNILYA